MKFVIPDLGIVPVVDVEIVLVDVDVEVVPVDVVEVPIVVEEETEVGSGWGV